MSNSQHGQGVGSPISNDAYNIITALQAKLEGLEAYRKYQQGGGNSQLWQQLNDLDTQAVQILTQELQRLVQAGQLQLQQPGQTDSGAIQMGPAGSTA